MQDEHWSPTEKKIARAAFDKASEKEHAAILREVHSMLNASNDPRVVWRIHDYLSERRREHDQKFDYRYSELIFVFARLIREGWLTEEDLAGLAQEKLEKIRRIFSM
jgi:Photoprotection regulator fluorescence recovery protein